MVRCADCGCLAGTDPKTNELVEVDIFLREKWEVIRNGAELIRKTPVCCKRLIDFQGKLGNKADGSLRIVDVAKLIHDEIGACAGFEEYRSGHSPNKILDMIDQKENQKFQDDQREKERRWQAEQSVLADKRQEERDERQRQWQDRRDEIDRVQKALDRTSQEKQKSLDRLWHVASAVIVALIALAGVALGWFLQSAAKVEKDKPPEPIPAIDAKPNMQSPEKPKQK